ncbi:hypothetical protein N7508_004206 [Penicillium antarcticum]|uniref:uncharacterized protein n=1 Tax=Penicillium antarcticum TaxID=416450 RepID=UPI002391E43B|nr:uncharacterized protein N7508_004206 [Penicillium antarcticum]KAJ5308827.1 hypothetical protein N7508_004206 [Penicillium antarcticum]
MAPKGSLSTRLNPMRLNTINHLRVRRPNQNEQNPCTAGPHPATAPRGCAALEAQLRKCMDAPKSQEKKKNTVNYHLMRMYPKVVGPRKKDGVLG